MFLSQSQVSEGLSLSNINCDSSSSYDITPLFLSRFLTFSVVTVESCQRHHNTSPIPPLPPPRRRPPVKRCGVIVLCPVNFTSMLLLIRHPFDSSKWGRICQFLISAKLLDKKHLVEPVEASTDDLLVVHTQKYLTSLKNSVNVATIMEVGGTILAAKLAKERGWVINMGGGFNHCLAENGGGFCMVLVIDLDAHQGNGHERDFSNDRRVYILDMYNTEIYPFDYEAERSISQKVEVRISPDGVINRDEKKGVRICSGEECMSCHAKHQIQFLNLSKKQLIDVRDRTIQNVCGGKHSVL
ncbi:Histone deacetylase 2-like protein [Drosera capensis]